MRLLALVGVIALLSGCGVGVEEPSTAPADSQEVTQMGPPESWCRSYTTQKYCPKNICVWYASANPPYCGLPAASVDGAPVQALGPDNVQREANWPGEPECYTNRDCDTICGGLNAGVCNRMGKCECLM
jgi:hypothetical protein